ncbi:MAG: hypothetical protein IT562_02115 [Alphaproteobacteria bacterium]|nr:hypothetical protein [Alphaproteobacteria bacterium]
MLRYAGQAVIYGAFGLLIGYFSASPSYTYTPADRGEVKLSFSHGGQKRGGCRQLSAEEIAKLPPNMRVARSCPRERVPLLVEMDVDGKTLYRAILPPSGLSGDGASRAYRRFGLAPGPHRLGLRLRDSDRAEGFDYERAFDVVIEPRQNIVVDFRTEAGGFVLR